MSIGGLLRGLWSVEGVEDSHVFVLGTFGEIVIDNEYSDGLLCLLFTV